MIAFALASSGCWEADEQLWFMIKNTLFNFSDNLLTFARRQKMRG
jgi:hypothetical protein